MARLLLSALAAFALAAMPGMAGAPEQSKRPVARGSGAVSAVQEPAGAVQEQVVAAISQLRPLIRPPSPQDLIARELPSGAAFAGMDSSLRPWLRPESMVELAMAQRKLRRNGAVCGDISIQGEREGRVRSRTRGCGIKDAVRITSVSGVSLSQSALLSCNAAKALKKWVDKGVQPAFASEGPVVKLQVAAHYTCRPRNNQSGARISEHGRGNAIDISAFILQSGKVVSVLSDWTGGGPLADSRKKACGIFKTVLGPGSDPYHGDHFHLDVAQDRSSTYCR
ncbi:extensin-like domain-containing protein [Albibacillus kandeliae]|uniref:extensin-like domain-containing protein n=1 Tax=Albibacillus kandeliae TaxID=2174228 RepID=UPI000D68676F|nr:extensin family protein [Albibacillus kandeliae]